MLVGASLHPQSKHRVLLSTKTRLKYYVINTPQSFARLLHRTSEKSNPQSNCWFVVRKIVSHRLVSVGLSQ